MTNEIKTAIANMQSKRGGSLSVWKNANGTFSHHKDSCREWDDEVSCKTDLRFHMEWSK